VYSEFDALEAKLGLQPTGGGFARHPLEGGSWTYYAAPMWFDEQVVTAILSAIGGDYYVDLTVRRGPWGRETLSWQTIDKWRRFVIENWKEIVDLRAHLSGPGLTLNFNYENFVQRVTLEVRAPTKQASDDLVARFVNQLRLESLGEEQHWQVKTTAVYKVRLFSNEIFADELRAIVRALFPEETTPRLYEARVLEPLGAKGGEDEKQTVVQYGSLDEFLTRLGNDKAYTEAYLRLEGPRGKVFYVGLTGKLSRLEIRSSQRPGDFSQILKHLEKRLNLAVVSVTSTVPEKTTLKDSALVLIGLPVLTAFATVLTAFATGTVFSDSFRAWVTTKPTLRVFDPPKGGSVSPNVEIRWQLRTERFGSTHNIDRSTAKFIIIREGTQVVNNEECVPSGQKISLLPGKYTGVVNSCDYDGANADLQFEVQGPNR
jgi:hypothetical protein